MLRNEGRQSKAALLLFLTTDGQLWLICGGLHHERTVRSGRQAWVDEPSSPCDAYSIER